MLVQHNRLRQLSVPLCPVTSVVLMIFFHPLFHSTPSHHLSFYRETVVRLQSENKMLCVQEETYRQKLVEVQTELEDAQRSKNTLETQDRYSRVCACLCMCIPNKQEVGL